MLLGVTSTHFEGVPQLAHSPLENRMPGIWRNFGQRLEYKSPLVHSRVGDRKRRQFYHRTSKQQNVDINDARSLWLPPLPAHFLFKVQNSRDQLPRHFLGFELHRAIQEPRLGAGFDRLCLIKRGHRRNRSEFRQFFDRRVKVRRAVSHI